MKAIVVTDQAAGTAGMKLVERPEPQGAALASLSGANYGDVIVQVHASGFTGDELAWPSTWIDRLGRDRTPSIPGHELAGVATALSYGTTGLSVGQRVFGLRTGLATAPGLPYRHTIISTNGTDRSDRWVTSGCLWTSIFE